MKIVKAISLAAGICFVAVSACAATRNFDWYKITDAGRGASVACSADGNVVWGYFAELPGRHAYSVRKLTYTGSAVWGNDLNSQGASFLGVWAATSALSIDYAGNVAVLQAGVYQSSPPSYYWYGGFGRVSSTGSSTFAETGAQNIAWGWFSPAEPFRGASATDSTGNCIFAFSFGSLAWAGQSWSGTDPDGGILKLSPTGAVLWFKKIAGTALDGATGLAVDAQDNVYVSGFADGAIALDATSLPSNGGRDGFIAKYDKNGNLVWVKRPTCSGNDAMTSVVLGSDGALWFSGTYSGFLTFGNSISSASDAAFLGRMDSNGASVSVANLSGASDVSGLAAAPSGNIVAIGRFAGTSLLGTTVTNRGSDDVYVAEINAAGTAQWVKTFGYIYADMPGGVAVSRSGDVYVAATVNGGVVLDGQFVAANSTEAALLVKLIDPASSQLPVVTNQPNGTVSYLGGQASLSVQATSSVPVTYQWFRDGVAIVGQTSATLNIASVRPSDDANYYVEVTNQYGTVRSDSVHLIVQGDAPVVVTTIAGTNAPGFVDSTVASAVRFGGPDSPAIQADGVIVIPDGGNNAIRLLEPNGTVGTLAGKGTPGLTNGPASVAYFNVPLAVTLNSAWDIFVADASNNVVRKISATGTRAVTTYAGTGEKGFQDGAAAQAKFNFPNDLVCDPDGNLFVTEFEGNRVRKITTDGTVSTYAGTGQAGYKDGVAGQAMFNQPAGIARDGVGNLYVTEWVNQTIRKIGTNGMVSTIAGTVGQSGFVDGPALTTARLNIPNGICTDANGNIFFTDWANSAVRRIDPLGDVLTLVGTAGVGFRDGGRTNAQMNYPAGIALHPDGSLIVADTGNYCMRRVVWQTNAAPTEAVVLIEVNPSITIFGVSGKTYQIESSESLVAPDWTVLGEVTLVAPVETWFDTQPVTRAKRFYRAVLKQ